MDSIKGYFRLGFPFLPPRLDFCHFHSQSGPRHGNLAGLPMHEEQRTLPLIKMGWMLTFGATLIAKMP